MSTYHNEKGNAQKGKHVKQANAKGEGHAQIKTTVKLKEKPRWIKKKKKKKKTYHNNNNTLKSKLLE